ncbi:MAG: hypothetical protein QXY70_00770 [Nanopusillaceae archaeon]
MRKKAKKEKVYISCMLCKKEFKCKLKESITECAKRYKMEKIKIKDIIGFVCRDCYYKLLMGKIKLK